MKKKFKAEQVSIRDLVFVAPAPPPDTTPLAVGDWCALNSGSPPLLVVDIEGKDAVIVSLPSGEEATFPRACVRRCEVRGDS